MTEELISFECAKLAKEKGFILLPPSDRKRFDHTLKMYDTKGISILHTYSSMNKEYVEKKIHKNELFLKVSQSLLQRWLREVHNIILLVNYSDKRYFFGLTGSIEIILSNNGEIQYYNKYEQALEKGLIEALKLIK